VAITKLDIEAFLQLGKGIPVLDARSPSEYAHAHIPKAFSVPIFSDEERKIIGTAYKQESRETAIRLGLQFFGPRMLPLVDEVRDILKARKSETQEVAVHCWRGGMRSAAVAWLLDLYGFKVYLLNGGYKTFRHRMIEQFDRPLKLKILGGYTGSNKTGVLLLMKKKGKNVIDLEGLAGHMGSAFGNLDMIPQPSQEMFENLLGTELLKFSDEEAIWVEGESQRIGLVNIPQSFFLCMRRSPVYFLNIPFDERIKHILTIYGKGSREKILNATVRLQKRLGGLETKNAVNALLENDLEGCFRILLYYYDRLYLKSTLQTDDGEREIINLDSPVTDENKNYDLLMQHGRD
jgi:tRNA 2-selenouridine synthase